MKVTWERVVHHVGTIHGEDISNELLNRTAIVIPKPQYEQTVLDAHQAEMTRRNKQYVRLQSARKTKLDAYKVLVAKDPDAGFAVAELENDIEEAEFNHSVPLPIIMYGEDKANFDAQWRMYREKLSKLEQQRGQAYSMVRGQCMPVLLDKMKHDPEWDMTTK